MEVNLSPALKHLVVSQLLTSDESWFTLSENMSVNGVGDDGDEDDWNILHTSHSFNQHSQDPWLEYSKGARV